MSADDYKRERKLRGTQQQIADALKVHQVTIARRETGALPVTREAWLALLSLPKRARNKSLHPQ